jgi:Uma2 family endonuclease
MTGGDPMTVIIRDPLLADRFREEREKSGNNERDEVWEGVLVVPPSANNEHQRIVSRIASVFSGLVDWDRGDQVLPGANVSDRVSDWLFNYRIPDVLVYLAGNPAVDHGTFWHGGPDVAVEIVSRGEDSHAKFAFYASVNTRELLIVDRDPWAVELYQLRGGHLVRAGRSDLPNPATLPSSVLPLTFRLEGAVPRPRIVMTHAVSGQVWTA